VIIRISRLSFDEVLRVLTVLTVPRVLTVPAPLGEPGAFSGSDRPAAFLFRAGFAAGFFTGVAGGWGPSGALGAAGAFGGVRFFAINPQ
jgi:hypothetical protein